MKVLIKDKEGRHKEEDEGLGGSQPCRSEFSFTQERRCVKKREREAKVKGWKSERSGKHCALKKALLRR